LGFELASEKPRLESLLEERCGEGQGHYFRGRLSPHGTASRIQTNDRAIAHRQCCLIWKILHQGASRSRVQEDRYWIEKCYYGLPVSPSAEYKKKPAFEVVAMTFQGDSFAVSVIVPWSTVDGASPTES
jgi:hypothetical protein